MACYPVHSAVDIAVDIFVDNSAVTDLATASFRGNQIDKRWMMDGASEGESNVSRETDEYFVNGARNCW